jgi:hypothetical protein
MYISLGICWKHIPEAAAGDVFTQRERSGDLAALYGADCRGLSPGTYKFEQRHRFRYSMIHPIGAI